MAPYAATIEEYRRLGYTQMPEYGIHSVTVPGAVDAYHTALSLFGTMELGDVLKPAIAWAEHPVLLSAGYPRNLSHLVEEAAGAPGVVASPYVDTPSRSKMIGRATNLQLHRSLQQIASEGRDAFYQGVGRAIVNCSEKHGGFFTMKEFEEHKTQVYDAINTEYRGYTVYETTIPSQGHIALEELNIVEGYDLRQMGYGTVDCIHHMVEATKCAFADRLAYSGDPAFGEVPLDLLISKSWAAQRRTQIDPAQASSELKPGNLPLAGDTTSFVVADGHGNAASFIISLAFALGSRVFVDGTGIVLNNRGSYFFLDETHPNCLQPGKRTMHTLNTYIVCLEGEFYFMGNTPGGDLQPQLNFQAIVNAIDFEMDPQQIVDAPNWSSGVSTEPAIWDRMPYLLRLGDRLGDITIDGLGRRGHATRRIGYNGVQGVLQLIMKDLETGVLMSGSRQSAMGLC